MDELLISPKMAILSSKLIHKVAQRRHKGTQRDFFLKNNYYLGLYHLKMDTSTENSFTKVHEL